MKSMMLCREQFLKCPPPEFVAKSQLLNNDSKAPDDNARKSRRRREKQKSKKLPLDDSSNWVTDNEETSDDKLLDSGKIERICGMKKRIRFMILYNIFKSQTNEVKEVIMRLHQLQMRKINAYLQKQLAKPKPILVKRKKNNPAMGKTCVRAATAIGLQLNCKLLASLQRRRRRRGKPLSQNRRKKFPRRKPRAGAKKGNRQGRKRYLRAQRLFDKGFFSVGPKLMDRVWQAVKDPNCTATSFCDNNVHCLSKIHRKQIALYEKIEKDLDRLDVTRQERAEAAVERMAKEKEKEVQRQDSKNKIEIRAAARAERDALRKQRRAARKQRALEKRMRKQQAKAEMIKCSQ